ncbi:AraC family transcriptional regulator [Wansuia hejianensis]|uniref:Helix-turn-helix transcriptional regulator n=1 Tax=Wansuia hejianensis TaxID=2763667 RepID=A0A926EYY0_9FIRM|nr:AraC family transcriptional regulator [Wansuia hejianensis]MBC8590166.1 helix-turn-helix transcriptional regulator [Wansuia hejianensis]
MNHHIIQMDYKTLTSETRGLKEHFHNGYEIIFITEGESNFTINDNIYTYGENSLLFLNNLEKHKMDLISTPYSRYMIIVDSDYLDNIIKEHILLSIFKNRTSKYKKGFNIKEEHLDFINKTLDDLINIFSKESEFWQIEFMSMLSILLVFLYRNYTDQFPISRIDKKEQRILDIQHFIDENFRKDISLDSIASEFFISKYYLSHSFKDVTGFTIKQYILLKRISYAKNQLYFTDNSVTDIAMDCGFNSQSSFIRTFGEKEGITPLQFRKYYRANND